MNFFTRNFRGDRLKTLVLALIVFLLPWQAVWIVSPNESQFLRLTLYAVDVLMLGAVVWLRPKINWRTALGWCSPLVAVGYFLVASFFALAPVVAIWKLATLILLALFILTLWQFGGRNQIRVAIILSSVLESFLGCWQFLSSHVAPITLLGMSEQWSSTLGAVVVETANERWLRAYGTFPQPNILGGFLAIALLIAINQYFRAYEHFQTWWNEHAKNKNNFWREPDVRRSGLHIATSLAAITIIFLGLLSSFSRSAVLGFGLALVVYMAMKFSQNRVRATVLGTKLLFTFVAIIFAWSVLFPGLWTVRVTGANHLETISIEERISGYREAVNVILHHPFFGTGLQNASAVLKASEPGHEQYWYQPVHNVYLLLFEEIGLVGLAVLLVIFWREIKKFLTYFFTQADAEAVAVVIALVIIGLFDHYLWSLHAGLMFVIIASYLCKKEARLQNT